MHHHLYLSLLCPAVPDDAHFDFERGVLAYAESGFRRKQQSYAPHMRQLQRRLCIDRVEYFFHGNGFRRESFDYSPQLSSNELEPLFQ